MKKLSIRSHHLVVVLAIVMTIITGLLLLGLNKSTETEIKEKFYAEQFHLVNDLSREIETYLNNRVQLVDVLTTLSAFQYHDKRYTIEEIDRFLAYEKRNFVTKISLYDKTGTIIYSSNKEIIGHKLADSEIFQWAKKPENKDKQFISSPIRVLEPQNDSIPHLHFVIAAPIYKTAGKKDLNQKFVGVVTETLDFEKLLLTLISNSQSNTSNEHLWIMEKNGTLLFHADHPEMTFANVKKQNKTCMNCHVSFDHIEKMLLSKRGNIEFQLKNSPLKLASYTTLDYKNISWTMVLNMSAEEVTNFVKKNLLQSYLLLGMIALTFFTISFLIYRSYRLRVKAEEEHTQFREKSFLKEKIEESEKRYRNLVESSPDAIAVHYNGNLVFINEAGAKLIGAAKPEDLIGKPILEFVHPDFHEQVKKQIREVLHTNEHSNLLEEKLIRLDGKIVDVELTAIPTIYEGKQAIQIIIRDITDRKLAEEALRNREAYLSAIIENQPGLLWLKDTNSRFLAVNNAFAFACGRQTPDDVVGKTDLDVWPRELAEKYRADDVQVMQTAKSVSVEELVYNKGEAKWFETFKTPVKDNNGKIMGTTGYAHDITERIRSEVELRYSENKYRNLAENALVGIYTTFLNGEFKYVNNALCQMLEYDSVEDLMNNNVIKIYKNQQDRANLIQKLKEVGHVINYEVDVITKTGKNKYFILSAALEGDSLSGMMLDITERKQVQEELVKAKEKAEQSDKLKTEFLAQMSHEIRTPINIITSNINFISDELSDKIDKDDIECFDSIDLASKRIIRTVDLILNVAELQTSGYQPNLINIDLNSEILHKLCQEHQLSAKQKGLEFIYTSKEKNANIFADEYSIIQIFANLIDNAIKYTKKGKVEILLEKNKTGNIVVEIKDTGIGMSKEFLPRIFEPFVQEVQGYSRTYEGNGLGLALVKNYCEINNAVIEVESEKNVGSTFRVTFKS